MEHEYEQYESSPFRSMTPVKLNIKLKIFYEIGIKCDMPNCLNISHECAGNHEFPLKTNE